MRHLIMRLEAPLMAFGGETIDNYGVIRRFPSASMLTGLLANALGWRRTEAERHQGLQDRLVFAARIDREPAGGVRLTDYQTVLLGDSVDLFVQSGGWVVGWTTRGTPDRRSGALGAARSGPFTHQRWRDYFADMRVSVALRLDPEECFPTLEDLETALQEPARPLFIGRKPCLPSSRLFDDIVDADTALGALMSCEPEEGSDGTPTLNATWPQGEGAEGVRESRVFMLTDERNWVSGLHGGGRWVCEGRVEVKRADTDLPHPENYEVREP